MFSAGLGWLLVFRVVGGGWSLVASLVLADAYLAGCLGCDYHLQWFALGGFASGC